MDKIFSYINATNMEYLFTTGMNGEMPIYQTLPGQNNYFEVPQCFLSETNTYRTPSGMVMHFDTITHIMRITEGGTPHDINTPRMEAVLVKPYEDPNFSYFMENEKLSLFPKVHRDSDLYYNILDIVEEPNDEYSTWFKFVPNPTQSAQSPDLLEGYFYPHRENTAKKRKREHESMEEDQWKWRKTH